MSDFAGVDFSKFTSDAGGNEKAKQASAAAEKQKQDEVTLLIQGKKYGGWKDVQISRGIEHACATFSLNVSERYPQMAQPWRIAPGDACEVKIGDDLLITGWVDSFRPSFGPTEHGVSVQGRSKTSDFVDSSVDVDGGQFNGQTLTEIATALAKPFGLEVVTQAASKPVKNARPIPHAVGIATPAAAAAEEDDDDDDAVIEDVQCQQTETCFQLVERLARLQELLITDDEKGRLVLCHPGDKKASTQLVQGKNILTGSADLDESQRFQKYVVKGQRPGNKTKDGSWAKKSGKNPWGDVGDGKPTLPPVPPDPSGGTPNVAAIAAERAAWFDRWRMPGMPGDTPVAREDGDDGDHEENVDDDERDSGSGGGNDTATDRGAKVLTQVLATATDPGIKRYRVHVLMAEAAADDMDAEQRADWEKRRRIAKGLKASLTVAGWRQRDGRLWQTNEMVQINAPWLGLEQELVVSQVAFELSGGSGKVTKLEVTLPDAFLPDKIKKKRKPKRGKKGKKRGSGGTSWGDVGH